MALFLVQNYGKIMLVKILLISNVSILGSEQYMHLCQFLKAPMVHAQFLLINSQHRKVAEDLRAINTV
jgi:hypothetical protein